METSYIETVCRLGIICLILISFGDLLDNKDITLKTSQKAVLLLISFIWVNLPLINKILEEKEEYDFNEWLKSTNTITEKDEKGGK